MTNDTKTTNFNNSINFDSTTPRRSSTPSVDSHIKEDLAELDATTEAIRSNPHILSGFDREEHQNLWLNGLLALGPTGAVWLAARQNRFDYIWAACIAGIPSTVLAVMFTFGAVDWKPAKYARTLGNLAGAAYIVPKLIQRKKQAAVVNAFVNAKAEGGKE